MSSTINISSSSGWTITGPAWVTNLPFSGVGDYEFTPILSANGTGTYRTGEINIDYGDLAKQSSQLCNMLVVDILTQGYLY